MEPPAKRPRPGPSLLDDDEDDHDELFFQPQEVSARRDPGFKLSVKRACADQKLQATMAHIIEKYSHDFSGVGDEIDMETGEIVVNNGHLWTMRDEGDVGGDWMEEEEEEGIRLEDLTDEHSDNQDEIQDSEDDEDLIMRGEGKGKGVAESSNALVASRTSMPVSDGKLSSFFQNPYGGGPGNSHLGFGASPLAFGSSPFGFGNSPLAFGPWGLPSGFGAPPWGHQTSLIGHHAPPQRLSLMAGGGRYEFPAQEGYKSIWASGTGYEDDWALQPTPKVRTGFRKHVLKCPAKPQPEPQKLLAAPQASKTQSREEEDDDEDAILTGRPSQDKPKENEGGINGSEDEDDLMMPGSNPLVTPSRCTLPNADKASSTNEDAPLNATKNAPKTTNLRKRKRQTPEKARLKLPIKKKQVVAAKVSKVTAEDVETNQTQPKLPGKACDLSTNDRHKSGQTFYVELFRIDPRSRKDFQRIDKVFHAEIQPTPEVVQDESATEIQAEKEAETEAKNTSAEMHSQKTSNKASFERIIPNSQDTGTPLTSSAPQEQQPEEPVSSPQTNKTGQIETIYALSDDEAPIPLPRFEEPEHKGKSTEPVCTEPVAETEETATVEPTTDSTGHETTPAQPRKRGRPRKTENLSKPDDTPRPPSEKVEKVPEEPAEIPVVEEKSTPVKPRKRGRPRKSDIAPPVTDSTASDQIVVQSQTSDEIVTLEESQTNTGDQVGDSVEQEHQPSEDLDKTPRLRRELRWLRKWKASNPKAVGTVETPDAEFHDKGDNVEAPRKQPRSVRSREAIRPDEDAPRVPETAHEQSTQLEPPEPPPAAVPAPPLGDDPYEVPDELPPIVKLTPRPIPGSATPKTVRTQDLSRSRKNGGDLPSSPTKANPQTPRHTNIRTSQAPSSRRSILSLLSDDGDDDRDELSKDVGFLSQLTSSGLPMRRLWRSSALTTEVYRTPVKKRTTEPVSPGSVVKTPGGTVRTCGMDGYRCGRDFCFTCL